MYLLKTPTYIIDHVEYAVQEKREYFKNYWVKKEKYSLNDYFYFLLKYERRSKEILTLENGY